MPSANELSKSLIISSTCSSARPVTSVRVHWAAQPQVQSFFWRPQLLVEVWHKPPTQATASICSSTDPPSFLWALSSVFRLKFFLNSSPCFCSLFLQFFHPLLGFILLFCLQRLNFSFQVFDLFLHRLENGLHRPELLPRTHWRPSPSGHPFFNSLFSSLSLPYHRASPS